MDNKSIARTFRLLGQLMELHEENTFRTRAVVNTAYKLDKLPFAITPETVSSLSQVDGIGSSTAKKVETLLQTGSLPELSALLEKTPEGILEVLTIKGLGPKKIRIIWKTLGIESIGELYYACNENRLIEAKGFGLKTQEDIKKAIEFTISNQGWFLYANVEQIANTYLNLLKNRLPEDTQLSFTGAFRRKCEVLESIALIADCTALTLQKVIDEVPGITKISEVPASPIRFSSEDGVLFEVHLTTPAQFASDLFISTASEPHLAQFLALTNSTQVQAAPTEAKIYQEAGMDYIAPELREGLDEIEKAQQHRLPQLIAFTDLKGSLHNHSTYSDGVHSLEEMALYCKDELGLQYLGISDHSRTAVYAKGLPIDRVLAQWQEIDQLNEKLTPFKVFKGIESDILSDGSLDYPEEILAGFDFVVASIHSNLKMSEETATTRLLKAIENPYTTFLGHPTGRLLLSRKGYPIDHKKIIDACAEHRVAIEINANPLRLDLDWRWHRYAIEKGVLLAINPDAHRTTGFLDMHYGVHVARKGGVSVSNCLNAWDLPTIAKWFYEKRTLKK